ncbi:MAG: hypothetical protein A3E78_12750 [Alphaproteobacteria bacterium RIFCSPHIGHO2_12_FULL_63_12]|nr:MAG: hypothetical protein A3E78_12750 [Alphaproteobacteria bacterium RIFCSPHIGHO2_12_FULL_63_12]
MILRRVIAHFRKQEWTAIFLDFVIVVVGVFVGLQVSNWNAARGERTREAVYLAGVAADIRSDIAEIEEIIRVSAHRMSAMSFLLREAGGAPLPDGFNSARGRIEIEQAPPYDAQSPETIGVAMFILTTFDGNRLSYDTMVNTGGIGVIRDAALLRAIQSYYADVDKALTFETSLEVNRVKLVDAQQQAGLSPVDAMPAGEIVNAFAGDAVLLAAARNYWLYTNRHLKIMKELRAEADRVAAAIDKGNGR